MNNTDNQIKFDPNSLNTSLSLTDVFYKLLGNYKIILIATFLGISVSLVSIYNTTPIYKSGGSLLIENPSSAVSIFDNQLGKDALYLENETVILKSRKLAENVIKELWNSNKNKVSIFDNNLNIELSDSLLFRHTNTLMGSLSISNIRNTDV
ncbi:MAG: hypothetical protein CMG76_00395, partial [Candidatus Marinimicrobia bacterium]|nr:hypothetical protein [Candidatus Neomarinimicrobiota bacterium]